VSNTVSNHTWIGEKINAQRNRKKEASENEQASQRARLQPARLCQQEQEARQDHYSQDGRATHEKPKK
jgi:hypothetical protein